MNLAPGDREVSRTVRGLLLGATLSEQIVFIGRAGRVLAELDPSQATPEQLRAHRAELLSSGGLKAIAHLAISHVGHGAFRMGVRCSLVEAFDNPGQPTIHALFTFSNRSFWTVVPEDAAERWIQIWSGT